MAQLYYKDDIINSFNWLRHEEFGCTELLAIHKDFKPGKINFKENVRYKRFPKLWYATEAWQAVSFVSKHCKHHTCYFGINPRPSILKNAKGRLRSAREDDIKVLTSFYFDIDFIEKDLSDEHIAEIELFLAKSEGFFEGIGVDPPTKAFSGRGFHLLFSPAPIRVSEHSEIKQRLHVFKAQFEENFRKDIEQLKIKIDSTLDLRRMAKIYGTKKPDIKRISRFYGKKRIIDHALSEYLMTLKVKKFDRNKYSILKYGDLPQKFKELLVSDKSIRGLWEGKGKTDGDISCSGYDFSIVLLCLKKGITDINELTSILAQRPNGAFLKSGKDKGYIKRTISNSIMSC